MPNKELYSSDADREKALKALSDKLKKVNEETPDDNDDNRSGWAIGTRYASDFAAAVLVGAGIGYGFDYFTGFKPWGLITGIVLGFIAGTMAIIRAANEINGPDGESQKFEDENRIDSNNDDA